MISTIDNIDIQDDHITGCYPTFHLQNAWGKNIGKSYLKFNKDLNKYISFFKTNLAFIKQKKLYEAIELYEKMFNAGLINESGLNLFKEQFSNEQRVVSIVPELLIKYGWTYEEASTMGLEKFAEELKNKIDKVLISMKLVP